MRLSPSRIRPALKDGRNFVDADGHETVTHSQFLRTFERIVREVKEELAAQGREDEFVGAKVQHILGLPSESDPNQIIYSTIRFIEPEALEWYLTDCIALKKEFPHIIAGFDLVGDENVLRPLKDYMKQLLAFRYMQEEAGVSIPFVFHAGETLGDGTSADENLYDAILLGTKRIGHG